jgi:hypothetical protein
MEKDLAGKPLTLTDADISSERRVSRRSLLSALGLGLGAAAAAVVGGPAMTVAQGPNRCTDNDDGRNSDPPGQGRQCGQQPPRPTGCTDNDGGPNEDPTGQGRRCRQQAPRPTGCTDNDSGPNEDPVGYGTQCSTWI